MYTEFFRQNRWLTDEADDGRVALAKAIAARPDAVITEARLPGMAGFDLCRMLRSDPLTRRIPIVIVTSDAQPQTLEAAQTCGADAVLVKPCLPEAVWDALERLRAAQHAGQAGRRRLQVASARDGGSTAGDAETESLPRGRTMVRAHLRQITTEPQLQPPELVCPVCEKLLAYQRSYIGGVNAQQSEQYDYYECARGCGQYQYRHRTRRLRRL